MKGEVVGINTAIFSESGGSMGIGFAIPMNMANKIKEQLILNGRVTRGYLGVVIQNITNELSKSLNLKSGLLVSDVSISSPAEYGGVKKGDILTHLNNQSVTNVSQFRKKLP